VVTGRPKDRPLFQLDQQCYPFLELCDYYEQYPEEGGFVKDLLEKGSSAEVIRLLLTKRDQATGLVSTDETPGDDAVEYPYHFSSHVLLWYTMARLAVLIETVGVDSSAFLDAQPISDFAASLRATALQHFLTDDGQGTPVIAYLTDGQGNYTLYHDANDVPTLFAVAWGFLSTSEEQHAWHNTMTWAFTPKNTNGYCSGPGSYPGLGSVHSPGSWTLGFFQEWVYAQITANKAAEEDAWRRITAAMQWDGTFSEAVDPETAKCTSKSWFSWPGSMIASAVIDRRTGEIGRG
jgi:meiotically up-regulated gene 157 (Mug157) protein